MREEELAAIERRSAGIFMPGIQGEVHGPRGGIGVWSFGPYAPGSQGDAEFHAHARADVPALLAEVRRLRAAIEHALRHYYARCDCMPDMTCGDAAVAVLGLALGGP